MPTIEENAAEWLRCRNEFSRAQEAASEKAQELLRECLNPEQFASYTERRHFTVTASSGHRWEIWANGMSGNVVRLPSLGQPFYRRYCIHPPVQEFCGMPYYVADADAHLAQALALAADEGRFLRTAHLMERGPHHPYGCYLEGQRG